MVDVTNFTPKTDFQGSRENLHLVERFTRRDANTLEYVVTIEDPTTWTRPWTVTQEWHEAARQGQPASTRSRGATKATTACRRCWQARAPKSARSPQGRGPDPATLCSAGCGGFAGGFADDGEEVNPLTR